MTTAEKWRSYCIDRHYYIAFRYFGSSPDDYAVIVTEGCQRRRICSPWKHHEFTQHLSCPLACAEPRYASNTINVLGASLDVVKIQSGLNAGEDKKVIHTSELGQIGGDPRRVAQNPEQKTSSVGIFLASEQHVGSGDVMISTSSLQRRGAKRHGMPQRSTGDHDPVSRQSWRA
ncbi:hypothetical protein BDR07DRAFT_1376644 [Suillus spraguei]|nr:hypothetical protein BDR07DRAFT_1376644 [Suillus spraguei]